MGDDLDFFEWYAFMDSYNRVEKRQRVLMENLSIHTSCLPFSRNNHAQKLLLSLSGEGIGNPEGGF